MEGSFGLEKMVSSLRSRLPPLRVSRPFLLRVQPPRHASWSSYRRGYPCPGRVSTLLNQTYSTPDRLVHACLHVTEQVWQPMHLSRFITIAIWAITFMTALHGCRSASRACQYSTSCERRRITVTSSRWLPVGPR